MRLSSTFPSKFCLRLARCFAFLLVWPAAAAGAELSVSGYLKDIWKHSAAGTDGRPYFLNTARARLSLEGREGPLVARADYDHELLSGSFFRTRDYALFGLSEPPGWLAMEQTISTGDTVIWRHRLYRGWAGLEGEPGVLRFGRQRIAWGTGKLWNPTDVLNPYQPASIERDERRGVDAFYGRAALGSLSQAELAWAPERTWARQQLLGRLRSNWKGYDLAGMGGKVAGSSGSWIVGGDFAGELRGGTLHGEWSFTEPGGRPGYWRAGIGYDYSFTGDAFRPLRDASVIIEYFHNGRGASDPARYDLPALLAGREVALARDYLGASVIKELHALVKLDLLVLQNITDGSNLAAAALFYNAFRDLHLGAGIHRFGGARRTEFGRAANIVFFSGQYYF